MICTPTRKFERVFTPICLLTLQTRSTWSRGWGSASRWRLPPDLCRSQRGKGTGGWDSVATSFCLLGFPPLRNLHFSLPDMTIPEERGQTTTQTQMETATRRFRSQKGRRRDRRENYWAATPTHVHACREFSWIAISTHVFAIICCFFKPGWRLPPNVCRSRRGGGQGTRTV